MQIFTIGTARSGTCWLGRILASHPDIVGTIEEEPQFSMVTKAALYPNRRDALLPALINIYLEKEMRHGIYADKSHPALWLTEKLAEALPRARFIAIERDEEDVVNSMMKHPDVRARCETGWLDYPEPCPFLGLESYKKYLPLTTKDRCHKRWQAHHDEIERLLPILGPHRMMVVDYAKLLSNPEETQYTLQRWFNLIKPFPLGVK